MSYIAYCDKSVEPIPYDRMLNSPTLAFDIEASGYHVGTDVPYGFSVTDSPEYGYYASIDDKRFLDLLANEKVLKIAHNAKYDRAMLAKVGVIINNLCDPMIAAHLLEYESLSLAILAGLFLNINLKTFPELGKPANEISMIEWSLYSCPQSMATFALWTRLEKELKRLALLGVFWNIEMPLVPVLSDMELNGVAIDSDTLHILGREIDSKLNVMNEALDEISGYPGMNHNSSDQVADLLYNKFELPPGPPTSKEERYSVDKRYLEKIRDQHQYIGVYLFFKQLKTLKNSYVNSLLKRIVDGRVYGSFNQTRTRTSRLSSSDPNLQKIPVRTALGKRIRTAFVAPPGKKLVKADYDQIELKMITHWSQDPAMLAAFLAGRDIHEETAIRMFGDVKFRFKGKTANFQIVYGGGSQRDRAALRKAYPRIFKWISEASLQARLDGYVRTLGGRIRVIRELEDDNPAWLIRHGERQAISTIVQGSSAEEVKKGMRRAWEATRHTDAKMLMQVHDELIYEVPENQVDGLIDILRITLPTDELSLPLTVSIEVGDNWGEMVKVKEGERYVKSG